MLVHGDGGPPTVVSFGYARGEFMVDTPGVYDGDVVMMVLLVNRMDS